MEKSIAIHQIQYEETKRWLLEKHYAERMPSISYAYGLYVDMVLEGIVTYGSPPSHSLCIGICGEKHSKNVLELNRLAINSTAPKNSASKLVGKSLRMLPRDSIIVSYADTNQGHIGYVYQATNWIYTGATKARTDISADGGHSRHYDKNSDYTKRTFRSSKHRYIYFRDRKMIRKLKYKQYPYPKGESKRYECIDIINMNQTLL